MTTIDVALHPGATGWTAVVTVVGSNGWPITSRHSSPGRKTPTAELGRMMARLLAVRYQATMPDPIPARVVPAGIAP
jgi:hypothetical protein